MKVRETKCPAESGATACFTATITNIGDRTGGGRCELSAFDPLGQAQVGTGNVIRFGNVAPGDVIVRAALRFVQDHVSDYNLSPHCAPGAGGA